VWKENMGLYMIEWKYSESKKIDGFKKFMGMTPAELASEAGKNRTLIGNHIILHLMTVIHDFSMLICDKLTCH
jgi:hypothetical protein